MVVCPSCSIVCLHVDLAVFPDHKIFSIFDKLFLGVIQEFSPFKFFWCIHWWLWFRIGYPVAQRFQFLKFLVATSVEGYVILMSAYSRVNLLQYVFHFFCLLHSCFLLSVSPIRCSGKDFFVVIHYESVVRHSLQKIFF